MRVSCVAQLISQKRKKRLSLPASTNRSLGNIQKKNPQKKTKDFRYLHPQIDRLAARTGCLKRNSRKSVAKVYVLYQSEHKEYFWGFFLKSTFGFCFKKNAFVHQLARIRGGRGTGTQVEQFHKGKCSALRFVPCKMVWVAGDKAPEVLLYVHTRTHTHK